ncbi:MAG TPA: hypothetical protein PKE03_00070 [Bacteroidales bacterium]|nr:hypothetical protein [Bacteroidales bacterium]
MIYLLSHNDKKLTNQINLLVGKPFSLRQRWLMNGIGSGGRQVIDGDARLLGCLPGDGSIRKCNIELRPAGIVVGFHKGLETYAWVVPYYMLTIYGQQDMLSLYAGPHRLQLAWPMNIRSNQRFLDKLMKLRAESIEAARLP